MKNLKKRTRILLLTALVLIPTGIFFTGTGEALGPVPGGEWVCTAAAQAKEQAGFCTTTMVCREFCQNNVASGDFMCFNH